MKIRCLQISISYSSCEISFGRSRFSSNIFGRWGIVAWDQNGNLVGTFAVPWAVDANGIKVNTEYITESDCVIQYICTGSAMIYPAVADPFWIPASAVVAHFTRRALTQATAREVSQALMK